MFVEINAEQEELIRRNVGSDQHPSAEAFVASAIQFYAETRSDWMETDEECRAKFELALDQAERGELLDEVQVRQGLEELKTRYANRNRAA